MQTRKAEHHGLPGRLFFLRGESVGQARHRQQRIRLLDDLVPLQAVETDLMVAGGVPLFERGGVHRLQQLEAIVGAQVASHWVPRDLDALFQRLPSRQFLLAEAERRKAVGVLPLHPPGGRQRQVKVMADHHIGEKVVAGDPAVFIRSLAEQQVDRMVYLSKEMCQLLKAWRKECEWDREQTANETVDEEDYLFRQPNGKPMCPSTFTYRFKLILKANNLPLDLNVHSLRHTNASLLIAQGVDVRTVASLLGHAQASTTLDIYAHAFDKNKRKAQEKLGKAIGL